MGRRQLEQQDSAAAGDAAGRGAATGGLWPRLGSPKYVMGPMVDQSELAFRQLCRELGVDLAYTPMLHAKQFLERERYRRLNFMTTDDGSDRPLIAQFCANHGETLSGAVRLLEDRVDAVDINCGCPQGIAKRGNYGAFLLQQPDIIYSMVATLVGAHEVPVTCKIRKVSSQYEDTLKLVRQLEALGCQAVGVHGRTKEEKGMSIQEGDSGGQAGRHRPTHRQTDKWTERRCMQGCMHACRREVAKASLSV
eukprot:GHVU01229728.1.p1 GENE.GHVU01229728.1~~GHVU01229728.1.p1  ORF type:complete len:251 (+),score=43.41 GHVU01229728.1:2054-2806(+)